MRWGGHHPDIKTDFREISTDFAGETADADLSGA
jgi:hypothetical protein